MLETKTTDTPAPPIPPEHPYAVFRNADFFRYLIARFVASFGMQMLVAAVDWELFRRTGTALALGYVGLALMVPMVLCTLPAGHLADRYSRKKIILASTLVLGLASLGLMLVSTLTAPHDPFFKYYVYALLVVVGIARTFLWPASAAFVTALVPREQLPRAITFNSGAFQLSSVLGPAVGGVLIWLTQGAWVIYAFNALAAAGCLFLVAGVRHEHKQVPHQPTTLRNLITGFRFVYTNKIILGTLTLDMFAVRLGGAVADFCEKHPAQRPRRIAHHCGRTGFRTAACGDAHRRNLLRVLPCAPATATKGRPRDALVRGSFRRGDDVVWSSQPAVPRQIYCRAGRGLVLAGVWADGIVRCGG